MFLLFHGKVTIKMSKHHGWHALINYEEIQHIHPLIEATVLKTLIF